MKNMLHFFSRSGEAKGTTTYMFREPTLDSRTGAPHPQAQSADRPVDPESRSQNHDETGPPSIPADFAGIVAFFEQTVRERKSPYSALIRAADMLKEYIPNEINRLKAAYALCGDQWPADVLSFAISSHIADIDQAREKARSQRNDAADGQTRTLRREAERLQGEGAGLRERIAGLNTEIERLQEMLGGIERELGAIQQQIQLTENEANAMCFIDQAAENIKNDLLARKVILGLP
jgi:hypothetical protein